jgi:hypothetical protein
MVRVQFLVEGSGLFISPIYPSGFGDLLIDLIPKGKWLECEADCLSVCAKVNAWLSSMP